MWLERGRPRPSARRAGYLRRAVLFRLSIMPAHPAPRLGWSSGFWIFRGFPPEACSCSMTLCASAFTLYRVPRRFTACAVLRGDLHRLTSRCRARSYLTHSKLLKTLGHPALSLRAPPPSKTDDEGRCSTNQASKVWSRSPSRPDGDPADHALITAGVTAFTVLARPRRVGGRPNGCREGQVSQRGRNGQRSSFIRPNRPTLLDAGPFVVVRSHNFGVYVDFISARFLRPNTLL